MIKKNYIIPLLVLVGILALFMALVPLWWKIDKKKIKFKQPQKPVSATLRPLPEKNNRNVILFGASLSLSGKYETEGHRVKEGYEIWKDWVNAKGGIRVGKQRYPVKIIYYDDHSDKYDVRDNIRRLILEDKVDFLLGPFSSSLTLEASKISEEYGVIMVEGSGASETIFTRNPKFTFATLTSASWYFKDFFDLVSTLHPKPQTYALLVKDNLFSRSVAKGARIWSARANIKEVYYKIDRINTQDYSSYLGAMAKANPDIILFSGHLEDSLNFTQQLISRKDITPKAVIMTLGPTQEKYLDTLRGLAEGMMGTAQWVETSKFHCPVFGSTRNYVRAFAKKFGHHPTYQNAQSTACGIVYQLALGKCNRLDAKQVLQQLRETDCETFFGKIKFNTQGMNVSKEMAIVQIQGERRWVIWPREIAEKRPSYPLAKTREVIR